MMTGGSSISSVAFTADSKTLVSAVAIAPSGSGEITFWDVPSRTVIRRVKENPGAVTGVALLPDSSLLASVDNNKTISLWEVATGERKTSIQWGTQDVSSIGFSPDGETMVSSGVHVSLWDARTGQARISLTDQLGFSYAVFSGDGRRLAAAGPEHSIYVWELEPTENRVSIVDEAPANNGQ